MSGESNLVLDRLEAELFREALPHLAPDRARVEKLWRNVAAASVLGAGLSGVGASVPPASGTSWVAPRADATPSTAPAAHEGEVAAPPGLAPEGSLPPTGLLERPGLLQRWSDASFGARALLGAAVGGALLGFAAGYGSAQRAPTPKAASVISAPASHAATSPRVSEPSARPAGETDQARAEAKATTDEAVRSQRSPLRGGPAKAEVDRLGATPSPTEPAAESAQPSFYEELEYLKRAQSALRQGNGALALGLMTSLDSIQPGGALLSERAVIRVLAHCQLGDVESAQQVAERLAAEGLASVYTERLENSCAGAVFSK